MPIKLLKYILAALFPLLTNFIIGQNSETQLQNVYTISDGLPSDEIYHIVQTKDKYLWIATENGLAKFNGTNFKIFNTRNGLPDNTVYRLYPQTDGSLLGEAQNNKLFFVKNDSVMPYKFNDTISKYFKGVKRIYSVYYDDEQTMHCGTFYGYFYITKNGKYIGEKMYKNYIHTSNGLGFKKFKNYVLNFNTVLEKDSTNIYLTNFSLPIRNAITTYTIPKKKVSHEANYSSLLNDSISVIMYNHGVHVISNTKIITSLELNEIPIGVHCFDSLIWICTKGNGVYSYVFNKQLIRKKHLCRGLTVTSVLKDHSGNYWFSTREKGLIKHYNSTINYKYTSTKNSNLNAFYKSLNLSIVGFDDGLLQNIADLKDSIRLNSHVMDVTGDNKGNMFVIAGYAVYYLQNNLSINKTVSSFIYDNQGIARIKRINDTLVVINALKHIAIYNTFNKEIIFKSSDLPSEDVIICIEVINDTLFVATKRQLELFSKNGDLLIKFAMPCLITKIINAKQNGVLFACKDGQIYSTQKSKLAPLILSNDKKLDRIYDAIFDGKLICISDGKSIRKYEIDKEGLQLVSVENLSGVTKIYLFQDSLYYLTHERIYSEYVRNIENAQIPFLKLNAIKVNNQKVNESNNLELNYKENNLEFEFDIISYSHGEKIIKYKLLGLDSNNYNSNNFTLHYSKLPPGSYTLIARCSVNNFDYSEAIIFEFKIKNPFWKEVWFVIGFICVFLFIVFIIVKSAIRKQNEKSKLAETIATLKSKALASQLNPHLVFNILNSIQGIISEGNIEKSNIYLAKFAKFMRNTLNLSKQSIVTLDKEIEITRQYVELELLRFSKDVQINIQKLSHQNSNLIPPLTIQPFIENAIKHGIMPLINKKGIINVTFEDQTNYFKIIVEDNGIGINGELNFTKGDGLRITLERLKILNNENTIILDSKKEPTRIILKINKNV
ncbi:MAG: histidine kinase [Bacteroidota bacterium]|nr:histidine kinase [Bacteroidota bacterium]